MIKSNKYRGCNLAKTSFRLSTFFKLTLMSIIMFCVLLFHNSTKILKDNLILSEFGAESISFIKIWIEIPFISLFIAIYYWIYEKISDEKIFRIIIFSYMFFYLIFAFEIYPNRNNYHLDGELLETLICLYPNLKWFFIIMGKWSITLFYIIAESWPCITFSLLFWQLANKITTLNESKIIYPYFSFLGQVNLLIAGYIVQNISNDFLSGILVGLYKTEIIQIQLIILFVVLLGVIIIICHIILEKYFLSSIITPSKIVSKSKEQGIIQSLDLVLNNRSLVLIAISVVSYHVCVNLIEGIWLSKVFKYYTSAEQTLAYQGQVLFYTGISGLFFAVISKYILKHFNWETAAIFAPYIMMICGVIFFILIHLQIYSESSDYSLLYLVVIIGLVQNILIKGSKYGTYDAVKEMLYIPLSAPLKSKGKAAVDVISAKIGKVMGSTFQFFVFIIFPDYSFDDIATILMILFFLSAGCWIIATHKLGKLL